MNTRFGQGALWVTWLAPALLAATVAGNDTTADAVLGQPDFISVEPNAGLPAPTAETLALSNAAGIALGPDGRLYVSDAESHRVLSWPNAADFATGQAADLVLGQPDFISATPNRGTVVTASADSFFLPQGLAVDEAGRLWVADAFNSRVLRFDDPASGDGVADLVIGQRDFTSNGPNLGLGNDGTDIALPDSLLYPGAVVVRGDDVWVSDSGNSRVLHYTAPTSNKPSADFVLGQYGSFHTRAKNNDGTGAHGDAASADNLFNCIGLALDAYGGLYVADWANHRVLHYENPLTTDATADAVFGQPDFLSNFPDNGGVDGGLQLPAGLALDRHGDLIVADSGNHRLLTCVDPLYDQAAADMVFGQLGSFAADAVNHGLGPLTADAAALHGPTGVAVDEAGAVYVVDTNNSRVLRYDAALPPRPMGDFDADGDVDAADYLRWHGCLSGPGEAVVGACRPADLDADGDVDLRDYAHMGPSL